MVRVTLNMRVVPGCGTEFERAWGDVALLAERTTGHLRQALLRDRDDPSSFVITSDWESREAFERFERSPEQDALVSTLVRLRESVQMQVHDLLVHVDGGGS
jgi:heme-degrading monooxygenase HmoA